MGKTVMAAQFSKILGRVLAGLEEHAETGEVVGRKRETAAAWRPVEVAEHRAAVWRLGASCLPRTELARLASIG